MKIVFKDYTFDYQNHLDALSKLSDSARDIFAMLYSFRLDSNDYEKELVYDAVAWHAEHLAKDQLENILLELVKNGILRKR